MADVNLEVAVTSVGVPAAIQKLRDLEKTGKVTGTALVDLAARSRAAFRGIQEGAGSAARAATTTEQFEKAMTGTGEKAFSLTQQLKSLNEEYRRVALNNPQATAAQRLALAGNGSLSRGLAVANQAAALKGVLGSDILQDQNTVLREQQQLLDARGRALSAQKEVGAAMWQRELQAMSPLERATSRLQRATQELATSKRLLNLADQRLSKSATAANFDSQATAAQRYAAAIRGVAEAQRGMSEATDQARHNNSAFQSSFSYFILAGMAQQLRDSILSVAGASVTASSEIERSFADVDRTFEGTDAQLQSLRQRLRELATSTPNSFTDLAQIATLGNQLGIAEQNIQSFTTTIAQYTAVSGQSAEDAATAFGRISNLTGLSAAQYSNLASAITYVARTSVATESTIQNTAKEITALASGAGFSAQSIVGLAGALSSLAIPPERARGALSLYFGALNSAVAEGGPKLEAFATLTNLTADQLNRMVRENRGQEVFQAFIQGLSQLDTVAKTSALDTLGLSTIRVDQTMRALAQNVPLVTQSFEGADAAFRSNTEIMNQYGVIQATLASKIAEFQNAIQLAAGAVGDALGPALKAVLPILTDLIVGFTDFANTPIGGVLLTLASILGGVVLVLTTVLGAAALLKAGLTVIPWALTGLQATAANTGILRFAAGMAGLNLVTTEATAGQKIFQVATRGTVAATGAAAAGMRAMKLAFIGTGFGALVAVIGTVAESIASAGSAATITADDIAGLQEAISADTKLYNETGDAIATFSAKAGNTVDDQRKAAEETKRWAAVLGIDLVDSANAASDAVGNIAAGPNVTEAFRQALGQNADIAGIIKDADFAQQWQQFGLNMTDLIALGIKDGSDNGSRVADALQAALDRAGVVQRVIRDKQGGAKLAYIDSSGNDVTKFVEDVNKVTGAVTSEGKVLQETANKGVVLGDATTAAGAGADSMSSGFLGARDALADYQSAVSSALGKMTDFSDILDRAQAAAEKVGGKNAVASIGDFSAELKRSNSAAVTFFDGVQELASKGRTEFATQLAGIGPDAQGILTGALNLSGKDQKTLEARARFAAFLASDAFKTAFGDSMSQSFDAYALIFKTTGNLSDVQDYIKAQVDGTATAFEREWDANHPDAPLNVDLVNPTDADIQGFQLGLTDRIKVTATVKPVFDPTSLKYDTGSTTYTDTVTGASITLPANLDGNALSASLAYWAQNQNATPEEIEAAINTTGFSSDIDAWKALHGPIDVLGKITIQNIPTITVGVHTATARQMGGLIDERTMRGYAGGGLIKGPGTNTSDSIPIWASLGERLFSADVNRFWGNDFMESLDRKMLPTSIVNLLGAAVSGNSGPSHVTNVAVTHVNPVTRDPLKQLRDDSEMLAAGLWG